MMFGAAVMAVVWTLQFVLEVIKYATREEQKGNRLLQLVLCCLTCAMQCLKKTVEFISYFGFVLIAMEGYGFCRACQETFSFLLAHPAQAVDPHRAPRGVLGPDRPAPHTVSPKFTSAFVPSAADGCE